MNDNSISPNLEVELISNLAEHAIHLFLVLILPMMGLILIVQVMKSLLQAVSGSSSTSKPAKPSAVAKAPVPTVAVRPRRKCRLLIWLRGLRRPSAPALPPPPTVSRSGRIERRISLDKD